MKHSRRLIGPRPAVAMLIVSMLTGAFSLSCGKSPEPAPGPAPSSGPAAAATPAPSATVDPPVTFPPPSQSSPSGLVQFVQAPAGDVLVVIRAAIKQAKKDDRRLVIFNSSPRSEPCVKFHESGARGDLDGSLSKVTLLEFDLDRDGDRLAAAGYSSKVVPSFVIPQHADGRPSRFSFEGSVSAGPMVAFLAMKVQGLLMATRTGT